MAACGLDAGRRDSYHGSCNSGSVYEEEQEGQDRSNRENYQPYQDRNPDHVVTVMAQFAAAMMRTLDKINNDIRGKRKNEEKSTFEPYQ